jgi:beta-galactosamide-alpha-2,3-sialyltransferase
MNKVRSDSGKSLFICCTPLQGVIAKKIIEHENLLKKDCIVFFYTSFDNEVYRNYYNELRELCSDGLYYVWQPNFPNYIRDAKVFFRKFIFSNYYFASIDSVFVQLAVSIGKKANIYTFDDGTANIAKSSKYFKKQKLSFKRVIFFTMGNRYSAQRIRSNIDKHYTIFPDLLNISENKTTIQLFTDNLLIDTQKRCSVVLGTVYEEMPVESDDAYTIKEKIKDRVKKMEGEVFYIPHPREKKWNIPNVKYIIGAKIAEEVILNLRKEYSVISLFGFGSTAQINLALVNGVHNYYFNYNSTFDVLSDILDLHKKITSKNAKVINLN